MLFVCLLVFIWLLATQYVCSTDVHPLPPHGDSDGDGLLRDGRHQGVFGAGGHLILSNFVLVFWWWWCWCFFFGVVVVVVDLVVVVLSTKNHTNQSLAITKIETTINEPNQIKPHHTAPHLGP
jgi:hypothetical protein